MSTIAVVTGGASGLGRALGAACASGGMRVALLDRDGERATAEAKILSEEHGVQVIGLTVDVSDGQSVKRAADTVADRFGGADLVISNVGVQLFGGIDRTTDDEWQWVLDVNVVGSTRVVRAFLPLLREAPSGRLAFTSSSSVLDPASRLSMYQTSKFAVWGLAESLRVELAKEGIRVSLILPSGMVSRHLETSEAAQPDHLRRPIADEDDFAAMVESNPTMTTFLTTPEDAASGVIDAVLAGSPYVITHGDFIDSVDSRAAELRHAAETARARDHNKEITD